MQSPLRPRNWVIFILVNIFVSALTAFIVVRAVTQAANRSLLDAAAAPPAAVALVPTAAPAATIDPASLTAPEAQTALPAQQADAPPANALAPLDTPVPLPLAATQSANVAAAQVVTSTVEQPATTLPAANASVRISTVVYPGQRTREAVVIVNEGDQVDMTGWTLSNPRGQSYSFGSVLLFKDSFINLHTTSGVDVPTDLFWNRDQPAWQVGDVATLKRGDETVATFTVK